MEPRSRHFETQHRLLLLETLYDAGLSLGAMPDEDALVEDVLGRVDGAPARDLDELVEADRQARDLVAVVR